MSYNSTNSQVNSQFKCFELLGYGNHFIMKLVGKLTEGASVNVVVATVGEIDRQEQALDRAGRSKLLNPGGR